MKKPDITQGPWKVVSEQDHSGSSDWHQLTIRPFLDGTSIPFTVAKLPKRRSMTSTIANAKAIVATPDLIDALLAVYKERVVISRSDGSESYPPKHVLEMVKAALIKAGCEE